MAYEEQRDRWTAPEGWQEELPSIAEPSEKWSVEADFVPPASTRPASATEDSAHSSDPFYKIEPPESDSRLFQQYQAPESQERIPNFGHLLVLGTLLLFGVVFASLVTQLALHRQLFGVNTVQKAVSDIHYTLGSEALLYVFTLAVSLVVFPMLWHKGFFRGIQWNFATALRLRWRLVSAALSCLVLAGASSVISPAPTNAPIDRIFRAPGAAWLLFVFGISFAPFFEEMFFRGFLLPALCTAVDWCGEVIAHHPRRPLGPNGHPQWSFGAMALGAIATSIPFAMIHAAQTGYSVGPFFLLAGVSLVLCAVRFATQSLASSVLVHACYNLILFSIMLVGTNGFRHLDKM
jgi:membrane protease YdiL (CAAX protease family)